MCGRRCKTSISLHSTDARLLGGEPNTDARCYARACQRWRQTKVCLDAGKERGSAFSARSTAGFDSCCARDRFTIARDARSGDLGPTTHPVAGECPMNPLARFVRQLPTGAATIFATGAIFVIGLLLTTGRSHAQATREASTAGSGACVGIMAGSRCLQASAQPFSRTNWVMLGILRWLRTASSTSIPGAGAITTMTHPHPVGF